MPVIYSYPKGTSIIDSDSVLGTDQSNKNNTVTYTMVDIKDYVLKDLLDGVQFRLPIYGKPQVLTNSLFYQNTAAEAGTEILGDTVYLNNGNNIGNLIVAQNITSSDGNIVSTVGNIAAGGSIAAGQTSADPSYRLKVNGASNFTGAIIADSTLSVGGTLTVTGQTTLNGYTLVNNRLYTGGDLVIAGPVYDSNLDIGSSEQVLVSQADGTLIFEDISSVVSGDKHFTFVQTLPSASWVIQHNLGKFPSITVVDTANTVVYGEYIFNSINQTTLNFSSAFAGKAYLN